MLSSIAGKLYAVLTQSHREQTASELAAQVQESEARCTGRVTGTLFPRKGSGSVYGWLLI